MQLKLSPKAVEQLYGEKDKPKTPAKDVSKKETQKRRHEQKMALKRVRVEAREAAQAADATLRESYEQLRDVEDRIQKAENRLEKDRNDHRIRVERAQGRLQNLQHELERVHREMEQARQELAEVRANVPASVARVDEFRTELSAKHREMKEAFTRAEQAWSDENVSNSARRKRDRTLRREVKHRLG